MPVRPPELVTGWSWNFGDGSPISTVQNPTHIFSTAGTYTVTLNATRCRMPDSE
ncbi:MAG: PKD domain-containing protein [Chitinophagaceae bacterium]|nr:PKD domain-containing protein [Chitinophagaceae bacterium]